MRKYRDALGATPPVAQRSGAALRDCNCSVDDSPFPGDRPQIEARRNPLVRS